jgi:hypothetical protein
MQLHNARVYRVDTSEIIHKLVSTEADVCAVGGDFFPDLVSSIRELAPIAERTPVVYVPGNIDFYASKPMEELIHEAAELADRIGNIHLLYNSAVTIGDTRFLGTTLWTRLGPEHRNVVERISDFRMIQTTTGRWNVERQNLEHDLAVDFLESELSSSRDVATVVVTHNIPHLSVFTLRLCSVEVVDIGDCAKRRVVHARPHRKVVVDDAPCLQMGKEVFDADTSFRQKRVRRLRAGRIALPCLLVPPHRAEQDRSFSDCTCVRLVGENSRSRWNGREFPVPDSLVVNAARIDCRD